MNKVCIEIWRLSSNLLLPIIGGEVKISTGIKCLLLLGRANINIPPRTIIKYNVGNSHYRPCSHLVKLVRTHDRTKKPISLKMLPVLIIRRIDVLGRVINSFMEDHKCRIRQRQVSIARKYFKTNGP